MMYEDVIKDFAERTKKNLEVIERLARTEEQGDVFETTQLVNSCLGLLVFPKERYIDSIPTKPLDEMEKEGWPIPKVIGNFGQVPNLRELIRYLRNAVAHFNVEFPADGEGPIDVLKVWNTFQCRKTWQVELPVEDLRKLLNKFSNELIHWREKEQRMPRTQPKHKRSGCGEEE